MIIRIMNKTKPISNKRMRTVRKTQPKLLFTSCSHLSPISNSPHTHTSNLEISYSPILLVLSASSPSQVYALSQPAPQPNLWVKSVHGGWCFKEGFFDCKLICQVLRACISNRCLQGRWDGCSKASWLFSMVTCAKRYNQPHVMTEILIARVVG